MKKIIYTIAFLTLVTTGLQYVSAQEVLEIESIESQQDENLEDVEKAEESQEQSEVTEEVLESKEEIFEFDEELLIQADLESISEADDIEGELVQTLIRAGEHVLFNDVVDLQTGTTTIFDIDGTEHEINMHSALGLLVYLDAQIEDFSISQIQYYESFGALYLKCAVVRGVELCDNWQYVLNSTSPWSSIEQTPLVTDDNFVFYFGSPYQLVVPEEVVAQQEFEVLAQTYEYVTNTWNPRPNVTIGITQPDPNNPWSPTVLQSATSSSEGVAKFVLEEGVYDIGVEEDYYFPLYPVVSIVSTSSTSTATSTATTTPPSSSGGGSTPQAPSFSVSKAFEFLNSVQDSKGTFANSDLYTDWVAIAFASSNKTNSTLFDYMQSDTKIKKELTDNIRRAMVLLALRENPYVFGGTNYIQAIVQEFDGTQFGESYLVNDDIFALLVLQKVGYQISDEIISKTISFILSKQRSDGSWEGSVDLTAAAIQSLYSLNSGSNVTEAINKASNYIESKQSNTGGWTNAYDTSWALQAMNTLGKNWSKNNKTPEMYLASLQNTDGGMLQESERLSDRIWATSYAIPAVLGKSWVDILRSVRKQEVPVSTNSSNTSATSSVDSNEDTEGVVLGENIEVEEDVEEVLKSAPVVSIDQNTRTYANASVVTEKASEEQDETTTEVEDDQEENVPVLANISDVSKSNTSIWTIIGGMLMLGGAGLIFGRRFFL